MTDTEQLRSELIVYVGRRLGQKGISYAYGTIDNPSDIETQKWYKKPLVPHLRVGKVIRVHLSETDSVRVSGENAPEIMHTWEDEAAVLEWTAKDRADATQHETDARIKREAKQPDAFTEAIAPLREQYQKLIGRGRRAAFIAAVIQEITG